MVLCARKSSSYIRIIGAVRMGIIIKPPCFAGISKRNTLSELTAKILQILIPLREVNNWLSLLFLLGIQHLYQVNLSS